MTLLYESKTPNPADLYVRDPAATVVTWQGQEVLRLSGEGASLVIIPGLMLPQGGIEADVGTEGPAYAGIVFRLIDTQNYELAYAQPHTSGQWDALQYDPVFHGSNTWQLYHGTGAQQVAQVPPMTLFRLRVEFQGQRAVVRVGEQPPLLVGRLAHEQQAGLVGLWTYLPAYFANLRVWDDRPDWSGLAFRDLPEKPAPGIVTEWFLEGYGRVGCEPSGILNLNRYLPVTVSQVHLVREIEMLENGSLIFDVGFSDELSLQVDDQVILTGQNIWHNTPNWSDRGYVSLDHHVSHLLSRGRHRIVAGLKAREFFGYGMALRIGGSGYRLLPAHFGG